MTEPERYPPEHPEQHWPSSGTAEIQVGSPLPFGAHPRDGGVNFALFSRHADRVSLELYAGAEDVWPDRIIELDPHRFNRYKLLLDPYATAITHRQHWDFGQALGYDPASAQADLSFSSLDSAGAMPRCIVTPSHFDWEGDQPLRLPWSEIVIYETHLRGLTAHPSSGVRHPGTYQGLTEKLPYLKELGVTAIELMPVHEFNDDEMERTNPLTGERLKNFWGYNTVSFFAPKASYCSTGWMGQQVAEFKEMVKACHRAGIEVILDVVFNHSAEGNELGPTFAFRGIDNTIYYMLADDKRYYRNYTGTGNTLNANHPVVRDFILEALRYWTVEMHVDGFRFDLASVLDRDEQGNLLPDAPLLERIAEDPILREVRIIAEAWDAAGAYQVGSFPEARWAEWNGRYRDEVRRFWRGDDGLLGLFTSRVCGSADLYQHSGKGPESSINFVTCHDGFTLNDLVSYSHKHNQANGEESRDGADENYSANYGIEGETDDPQIQTLRVRQIKNFLVTLFVSRGVPMLLGGDEFRRTQQGNNNAYCQDNEISWYDWSLLEHHQEIHRFTRGMIVLRRTHPVLSRGIFYTDADVRFFNPSGEPPDWLDSQEKRLGMLIQAGGQPVLCLIFNARAEAVEFALPKLFEGREWRLAVDTHRPPPEDIREGGDELPLHSQDSYQVGPRSSVILVCRQ
ncbi:MAG: glycogen debranching protein GlgX [Chloroflexota bacterium]